MKTVANLFASLVLLGGCQGTVTGAGPADAGPDPAPDAEVSVEPVCAHLQEDLSNVTPTVTLVVDRSWSMGTDFGSTSRWAAVYEALMDPDIGLVATLESEVRFGATFYTSYADTGICPLLTEVEPARDNYAAIDAVYAGLEPLGHTPTGESLRSAFETIDAMDIVGPKLMLLATDGLPDTCATPHPNSTDEAIAEALGAAETAFEAGVATVIVSVGTDITEPHLQDMANAGAGLAVGGEQNAPYYVTDSPDELVGAFDDIIGGVRHCTFPLEGSMGVGPDEEGLEITGGDVYLDGELLEEGVDWRLRGQDTVQILGAACDVLQEGEHSLEGEFTCKGVIL